MPLDWPSRSQAGTIRKVRTSPPQSTSKLPMSHGHNAQAVGRGESQAVGQGERRWLKGRTGTTPPNGEAGHGTDWRGAGRGQRSSYVRSFRSFVGWERAHSDAPPLANALARLRDGATCEEMLADVFRLIVRQYPSRILGFGRTHERLAQVCSN